MNRTKKIRLLACAGIALLCAAASPSSHAGTPASTIIAQRGNVVFTTGDLQNLLAAASPQAQAQLQHNPQALAEFVQEQMVQTILFNTAKAAKWNQRPDVIAQAQQAYDDVIASSYVAAQTTIDPNFPTQAQIQAAYDANKTQFVIPRQYHLAQIFIAVPTGASAATDNAAKQSITAITQQAAKPNADFGTLAAQDSQDTASASKGGDLGWVDEDQIVPAVRDAVAGLAPGAISDPVRAPDGWHLLKLIDTKAAGIAPLAQVQDAIVKALRQQQQQQNERAYIANLLKQQPIEMNQIALSQIAQP
jgi:parvulin-like peptidyl-prolyl isomerase